MGLYIYRMVIDANCINARGNVAAMDELESAFRLGIIEIIKTSALTVEIEPYVRGFEKAKSYGTVYGDIWVGDTENWSGSGRRSRFEEIYTTLWGKMWKRGGAFQNELHAPSIRDAIHLDTCWINKTDFFVTNEQAILAKRDALYRQGFDVKIVTPEECAAFLKNDFKQDFGTDDIVKVSKRLLETHPILLGSNCCRVALIQDPKTQQTLFRTHWIENQLHIEANLYDSAGWAIASLSPQQEPKILHHDASLGAHNIGPTTFYRPSHETPNAPVEQYLRIGSMPTSQFKVVNDGDILLSGRIVPSGHLLFEGRFFNAQGELIAEIEKKPFKYLGCQIINSRAEILPL